jgi:glutathione S-transferase
MGSMPVLYSFRRCPYAMRTRMAIAISGIKIEHREILLRNKPPEMMIASPKGTVPVIILPDGVILDESLDIMRWALRQNDPEDWLSGDDLALIAINDGPFKIALDRYKYPHRYGLSNGIVFQLEGLKLLSDLNVRLQESPYLTGHHRALTDIAIFPFVRQYAATYLDWFDDQPLPALQKWLAEMLASPLFEGIMIKHPLWEF